MKLPFILLFCCSALFGEEISQLKALVDSTRATLGEQESLFTNVIDYQKKREQFLEDPDNGRLALSVVKAAQKVNQNLQKNHLDYLFSPPFLEEVRFFSTLIKESHG